MENFQAATTIDLRDRRFSLHPTVVLNAFRWNNGPLMTLQAVTRRGEATKCVSSVLWGSLDDIVPEAAIPIEWRIPAGLDARIKEGFRWTMMISFDTLYSDVRFFHRQMAETGAGKKLTSTAGAFLTAKCAQ